MAHDWRDDGPSKSTWGAKNFECTTCGWRLEAVDVDVLVERGVDYAAGCRNTPSCEEFLVFQVLES